MSDSPSSNLFSGVHLRATPRHSIAPHIECTKVRACGVAILLLLVCSVAQGQIDVPAESDQYRLIVARLTTPIPDGAYVADGGWEVIGSAATVRADYREYPGELLWTGTPGVYQIVFDGILLKDVTFKDGAGNDITIKSYIGRVKAKATCKIKGGDPPTPDPVNPYKPAPAYQAAAEPVRKLSLSQADSRALADLYSSVAGQARAGGYTSMAQIRSDLVKRGTLLSLKGKYSGLSSAVESYLSTSLGLVEIAPAASVGDVFETLAWAVWEAGRQG